MYGPRREWRYSPLRPPPSSGRQLCSFKSELIRSQKMLLQKRLNISPQLSSGHQPSKYKTRLLTNFMLLARWAFIKLAANTFSRTLTLGLCLKLFGNDWEWRMRQRICRKARSLHCHQLNKGHYCLLHIIFMAGLSYVSRFKIPMLKGTIEYRDFRKTRPCVRTSNLNSLEFSICLGGIKN